MKDFRSTPKISTSHHNPINSFNILSHKILVLFFSVQLGNVSIMSYGLRVFHCKINSINNNSFLFNYKATESNLLKALFPCGKKYSVEIKLLLFLNRNDIVVNLSCIFHNTEHLLIKQGVTIFSRLTSF